MIGGEPVARQTRSSKRGRDQRENDEQAPSDSHCGEETTAEVVDAPPLKRSRPWTAGLRAQLTKDIKAAIEGILSDEESFVKEVLVRSDVPLSEFEKFMDTNYKRCCRGMKLALFNGEVYVLEISGNDVHQALTQWTYTRTYTDLDHGPLQLCGGYRNYTADSCLSPFASFRNLDSTDRGSGIPFFVFDIAKVTSFEMMLKKMETYFANETVQIVVYVKLFYSATNPKHLAEMYFVVTMRTEMGFTTRCVSAGPRANHSSIETIREHFSPDSFEGIGLSGFPDHFDTVDAYIQFINDHDDVFRVVIPQSAVNYKVPEDAQIHEDLVVPLRAVVKSLGQWNELHV